MGQVTVSLNGRTYRLRCGDGEEQRLSELADHVGQRIEQLALQFGQYGDERLLVMAALLITDDMLDMKTRLDEAERGEDIEPAVKAETLDPVARGEELPRDAVIAPPVPLEAAHTAATDIPPEPAESITRPVLRRGSLEARLAQARVGAVPKTGT